MRSNEAREQMVERVQAAKSKWPRLEDMPSVSGGWRSVNVNAAEYEVDEDKGYVKALYAACYRGEPIGRNGLAIFVSQVEDRPI